ITSVLSILGLLSSLFRQGKEALPVRGTTREHPRVFRAFGTRRVTALLRSKVADAGRPSATSRVNAASLPTLCPRDEFACDRGSVAGQCVGCSDLLSPFNHSLSRNPINNIRRSARAGRDRRRRTDLTPKRSHDNPYRPMRRCGPKHRPRRGGAGTRCSRRSNAGATGGGGGPWTASCPTTPSDALPTGGAPSP